MAQNLVPLFVDKLTGNMVASNNGNNGNGGNPNQNQGYEHIQLTPISTWVIPHNFTNKRLLCQVYDINDELILPDLIKITDADTVTITFGNNFAGSAKIIFF